MSCHFFKSGLFTFLILKNSFYILEHKALIKYVFYQHILPNYSLFFKILLLISCRTAILILIKTKLTIFPLIILLFVLYLKSHLQNQGHKDFLFFVCVYTFACVFICMVIYSCVYACVLFTCIQICAYIV